MLYISKARAIQAFNQQFGMDIRTAYIATIAKELLSKIERDDVVPVIRCKDCVHYGEPTCQIRASQYGLRDDDFCSYGEQRIDT